MSDIDKAISIATKAHAGQLDKAGQPYILHPLRLMFKFHSNDEMIVAVLHDVVEDSSFTLENLKDYKFSEVVINAIAILTKSNNESYEDFILRVSNNELARKIKIEDIKDNLDLTRLNKITDNDLVRIEKYHRALKWLINK
ncbi:MAG: (p)ppGpp synthase/HD superfamily hydrolase [Oleiphilaceae bacterium]